jgi:hypothetical protein
MDRGNPLISGIPVNEPLRYEYPALKRLTGLTRFSIMNYINKEVRYKNNYHNNNRVYEQLEGHSAEMERIQYSNLKALKF